MNLEAFLTPDGLVALVTLSVLEVVLGIDNVIFISILAGKLPANQQEKARRIGLMAAMGMRILLLMSIAWIVRLTAPLFTLFDIVFSLDSVITAVGMAEDLSVMVAAVVIAVGIMMFAARPVSAFVESHPTVKVLALSFLLLIGCSLVAEGA